MRRASPVASTGARTVRSPDVRPVACAPVGDVGLNAVTVDVEDWYQSCFDLDAPISDRVVRNTERLLAVFDGAGVKGTFFVQGLVAEAFPRLVAELAAQGHEVQSHGHTHRSLLTMSPAELRREMEYAKGSVEDAAGVAVTAFRAPDFSISASNLWALEILADMGFEVDSSIFPGRSPRYGIAGWEVGPHRIGLGDGRELLEVPVAVWPLGRLRLPVGGGGYWRLLPEPVLARGLRAIHDDGRPVVVYCHPYEFSPRELDDFRTEISPLHRAYQGLGRGALIERMSSLLRRFPFGRLDETLASWGIPAAADLPTLQPAIAG